ncbi:MAG: hypothetical protein ACLSAH_18195 [Bilophila wadsworthia]
MRRHLKQHAVEARITCVGCGLEIARQGFTNATPALLMNQYTITEGKEITEEAIETFCKQLLVWIESNKPVPASGLLGTGGKALGRGVLRVFPSSSPPKGIALPFKKFRADRIRSARSVKPIPFEPP